MLNSEIASSVSAPSRNHGGDPAEERKIPAAAACVSVGELRAAVVFDGPRELRAMRMWDGLVVMRERRWRYRLELMILVNLRSFKKSTDAGCADRRGGSLSGWIRIKMLSGFSGHAAYNLDTVDLQFTTQ